jgi:hypothetical protein
MNDILIQLDSERIEKFYTHRIVEFCRANENYRWCENDVLNAGPNTSFVHNTTGPLRK